MKRSPLVKKSKIITVGGIMETSVVCWGGGRDEQVNIAQNPSLVNRGDIWVNSERGAVLMVKETTSGGITWTPLGREDFSNPGCEYFLNCLHLEVAEKVVDRWNS